MFSTRENKIIKLLIDQFLLDRERVNMVLRDALDSEEDVVKEHSIMDDKEDSNICDLMNQIIRSQIEKEQHDNLWSNALFGPIDSLKSNNVGVVGETFLSQCCVLNGIESCVDGCKTKKTGGGGIGDGWIKGKSVEIKTARQGNRGTFQHELGEHPWTSDYLALVDIVPDKNGTIYLSIIDNYPESFYQMPENRKALPYFDRKITRRKETSDKESGAFKLTIDQKVIQKAVESSLVLEINKDTTLETIGQFINERIV